MAETAASTSVTDADDKKADTPPVKRFDAFLKEHRGGGLHNEVSEELQELVAACQKQQKKGSLTIKVNVDPVKGAQNLVTVTDVITVKPPEEPSTPSSFFTDDHGNLSRRDPRQPELDGLRDVSAD